jgi:hypothetical protein
MYVLRGDRDPVAPGSGRFSRTISSRLTKWSQSLIPRAEEKKVSTSLVMGICGTML